jgi:hypothetical protein
MHGMKMGPCFVRCQETIACSMQEYRVCNYRRASIPQLYPDGTGGDAFHGQLNNHCTFAIYGTVCSLAYLAI